MSGDFEFVLDVDRVVDGDVEVVPDVLIDPSSLLKASLLGVLQEDGTAPTIGSMETVRRPINQRWKVANGHIVDEGETQELVTCSIMSPSNLCSIIWLKNIWTLEQARTTYWMNCTTMKDEMRSTRRDSGIYFHPSGRSGQKDKMKHGTHVCINKKARTH